jgi:hypothetical protein
VKPTTVTLIYPDGQFSWVDIKTEAVLTARVLSILMRYPRAHVTETSVWNNQRGGLKYEEPRIQILITDPGASWKENETR